MQGELVKMKKNISEQVRTMGALLRLPYEKLQQQTYNELAAQGYSDIRPAHSSVFRHILPGGSRLTELADRAQMTKQSMSYLVNSLAESGYVHFVPDAEDGRAKLVCLTERGQAFQQALVHFSLQVELDLTRQLGAAQMQQLRSLLEQVSDLLDPTEQRNTK
jgi:DNA-binding MarR family transcriptional regulator